MTAMVAHWDYGPANRHNAQITTTEVVWLRNCKEQRGVVIGHDQEDNGDWVAIVRIENKECTATIDRVPFSEIIVCVQSHYNIE